MGIGLGVRGDLRVRRYKRRIVAVGGNSKIVFSHSPNFVVRTVRTSPNPAVAIGHPARSNHSKS